MDDRPHGGLDRAAGAALFAEATAAAAAAYAPYSHFPVGAAVLTATGEVFIGVNIENASIGLTVCAERVAVFQAVAAGHRSIRAVAVAAPKADRASPCGACRQVLYEFVPAKGDMTVILQAPGEPDFMTLTDLLPRGFGPSDLDGVVDAVPDHGGR